jgi:hypothetical protein
MHSNYKHSLKALFSTQFQTYFKGFKDFIISKRKRVSIEVGETIGAQSWAAKNRFSTCV